MDMPPAVALAFFGKLDSAAALMGGVGASEVHEWRIGTLFSGSDIAMFVAHYQCVLWRKVHGVNIEPKCVFQAELDEDKRRHLISHTPALHTFGDVAQLTSQRRLHCYRTQQDVLLPWAHTLIAGFPCTSRSKMNKSAHTHKTCVQDAVGTTGTGFASTKAVIALQRPRLIILENVPALQEKPDPESMSDAEYIVAELQALGYWSKWFCFDAKEFGSLASRQRIYLVGVLHLPQSAIKEAESFAHEVFCAVKHDPLESSAFVCHDRDKLVSVRLKYRFLAMKGKQKSSENASFRDEHFEVFKFARLVRALKLRIPYTHTPSSEPSTDVNETSVGKLSTNPSLTYDEGLFERVCGGVVLIATLLS